MIGIRLCGKWELDWRNQFSFLFVAVSRVGIPFHFTWPPTDPQIKWQENVLHLEMFINWLIYDKLGEIKQFRDLNVEAVNGPHYSAHQPFSILFTPTTESCLLYTLGISWRLHGEMEVGGQQTTSKLASTCH